MNIPYAVDEDYFSHIDTEAKAYWLGFIVADGCIKSDQRFGMNLAERDADHLAAFRTAVGYAGPIHRKTCPGGPRNRERKSTQVEISIARTSFVRHLINLGVVPRKTWSDRDASQHVPAGLLRHYFRGLVDGDGWVDWHENGSRGEGRFGIGLCGTLASVSAFVDFVREHTGVPLKIRARGGIYIARTSGAEYPQRIARLLYEGATIALARKAERARSLLAVVPKRTRLLSVRGETANVHALAERIGLSAQTIRTRLKSGMSPEDATGKTHQNPQRLITFNGETHCVREWARRTGLNRTTIEERLKRGDTTEQAMRPVSRGLARGRS